MADKNGNHSAGSNESGVKSYGKKHSGTRKISYTISLLLLVAVIFLILIEIGSTRMGNLSNIYFVQIDLSHVIPSTISNARLLNTIAQSIGLHDHYQFGLWGYCEGNIGQGTTFCSKPQSLYWFNPVEIITSELLAGATIAIPTQFVTYLKILKIASQFMFGFFLTAIILCFLMVIIVPFCRHGAAIFFASLFTLLACLCTIVGSVIGTAISIILTSAATSFSDLNIGAQVGKTMFAFMWVASGLTLIAFLMQSAVCCCCRKRRKREISEKSVAT